MIKFKKSRIIIIVILVIVTPVLLYVHSHLRLDAYLPHDKIQITLPFEEQYDNVTRLVPMGETIQHPKSESPKGHPGIDFGSQEAYPYIAVTDGKISKVGEVEGAGTEITLTKGLYRIVYAEMDPNKTFVKQGQQVKQGDKIAFPFPKENGGNKHFTSHWEFASVSIVRDRFCPMTYFTEESRKRIESIWENQKLAEKGSEMIAQFPEICSGDYYNRVD